MLEAFIKIRKEVTTTKSTGNVKFYHVKGNKADHIAECVEICTNRKWEPKYQDLPDMPVEPICPDIGLGIAENGEGVVSEGGGDGSVVRDMNENMEGSVLVE